MPGRAHLFALWSAAVEDGCRADPTPRGLVGAVHRRSPPPGTGRRPPRPIVRRGGRVSGRRSKSGPARRPARAQGGESADRLAPAAETPLDRMLRLERAWRAADPKRAGGGEAALTGFRYQFSVAVLDVVRRF